ncbi:MAG TPA: porin [Tabrizicola sp.]|nr:porin [Tabrizicola sp.]
MIHDPAPRAGEPPLPLFDEEALDIADYLKSEQDAGQDIHTDETVRQGVAVLTLGAIGVVYGDIGTSPIYAFREALKATGATAPAAAEVLGILSLLIWTLILIVTVKYVFFLLRADNRGEGGILALYTLVRLAAGKRSVPVLLLALSGAALFAGDAAITPAISVLSAVEGLGLIVPALSAYVLPVTLGILVGLFIVQRHGTASVAKLFGQIEGSKVKATNSKDDGYQIGAQIPLGAPSLWVSYARENNKLGGTKVSTASAYSLMAQYPLSKRTYVYAAYLNGEIDPVAAGVVTQKNRNFGLGLVHNF